MKEEVWWTTYKVVYENLVKPKKLDEYFFTKDETRKMFEAMLGEKPLPVPVTVPTTAPAPNAPAPAAPVLPVTRDVPPEKWETLWQNIPQKLVGKPEVQVVTCEDALESCIVYGIELGIIWPRLKTGQEKWELEKKARVVIELETSL